MAASEDSTKKKKKTSSRAVARTPKIGMKVYLRLFNVKPTKFADDKVSYTASSRFHVQNVFRAMLLCLDAWDNNVCRSCIQFNVKLD
jgi:hypothetical protein